MFRLHTLCVPFVVGMIYATTAVAVPLVPGGVIFPTGTTSAADPNQAGLIINDNLIGFRIDPTPVTPFTDVGGNVQNRVVDSTLAGTLIFGPRIRDTFNIDGGTFNIIGFTVEGFGSFATDVDFRTDGLGDKGFTSTSRSADGNILTFRYDDPLMIDAIAPGLQEESLFPAILTDATNFALTGRMTIFGNLSTAPNDVFSVSIGGIAVPVAPIPLPAAGWMFLAALGGLSFAGWKRRRTAT